MTVYHSLDSLAAVLAGAVTMLHISCVILLDAVAQFFSSPWSKESAGKVVFSLSGSIASLNSVWLLGNWTTFEQSMTSLNKCASTTTDNALLRAANITSLRCS